MPEELFDNPAAFFDPRDDVVTSNTQSRYQAVPSRDSYGDVVYRVRDTKTGHVTVSHRISPHGMIAIWAEKLNTRIYLRHEFSWKKEAYNR